MVNEKVNMVKYVIGERQVLAKMKNGEFRLVKLQVGLPEPLDNRWQSEIALDGLYPNVVKVPGVDSFQCLNLAFGVDASDTRDLCLMDPRRGNTQ